MTRRTIPESTELIVGGDVRIMLESLGETIEPYLKRHLSGDPGELPKSQQWGYTLEVFTGRKHWELLRSLFRLSNGKLIAFETAVTIPATCVTVGKPPIWDYPM